MDWSRHAERIRLLPEARRAAARHLAEQLVIDEDCDESRAVFDAVRTLLAIARRDQRYDWPSPTEHAARILRPKE